MENHIFKKMFHHQRYYLRSSKRKQNTPEQSPSPPPPPKLVRQNAYIPKEDILCEILYSTVAHLKTLGFTKIELINEIYEQYEQ